MKAPARSAPTGDKPHNLSLRFRWSLDSGAETGLEAAVWKEAGSLWDTSELSDEYCTFGEFTGTFVGLACVDSTRREKCADFDWFEYRDFTEISGGL